MVDILEMMRARGDLPALPDILIQLNKKLRDPNVSMGEISAIIEVEPSFAGKVSSLANSAFFAGGRKEVHDLKMAVARLGLSEVKNLVFTLAVHQLFSVSLDIDQKRFWTHSLAVGTGSRNLARMLGAGRTDREVAYMAGLLHDIGILVFGYLIPMDYSAFLKEIQAEQKVTRSLHALEWDRFGVDHPKLGAEFVQTWWQLNEEIVLAIQHHHVPLNGEFTLPPVSRVVSVVNSYCSSLDFSNSIKTFRKPFDKKVFYDLHLNDEQIDQFTLELKERVSQQAASIYGG